LTSATVFAQSATVTKHRNFIGASASNTVISTSAQSTFLFTDKKLFDMADWVEIHDPQSGKQFFANTRTGECSWDRPAPPIPV
jgi:hypothetical protein